jgi:hypothetical protein
MTIADRINRFNHELNLQGSLPDGIRVMNPFRDNPEILEASKGFYQRYYDDNLPRRLILGINPGRLGAGATGIPFTDSKRLSEICNIRLQSVATHEPSSVFVYDLISRYGGVEKFYHDFLISSLCPLGFIRKSPKGNWVNCNYYDREDLFSAVRPFILQTLRKQTGFGTDTSICYVLGKKNARYLEEINREEGLFKRLVVFDHPRFIEQYKSRQREEYISGYLKLLQHPSLGD